MLDYYLGSLAFGGVMILASLVFGDSDVDADVDIDVDADVDVDVDGEFELDADADMIQMDDPADVVVSRWLPFLSLRFWTFALASFGLCGTLLTLVGTPSIIAAVISGVMGVGIGTGASWMFRQLSRTQVTARTSLNHLRGVHATVLLPIRPGGLGKVRMLVDGQQVDVIARTSLSATIEPKATVLVVNIEDGKANVTTLPVNYREPTKE